MKFNLNGRPPEGTQARQRSKAYTEHTFGKTNLTLHFIYPNSLEPFSYSYGPILFCVFGGFPQTPMSYQCDGNFGISSPYRSSVHCSFWGTDRWNRYDMGLYARTFGKKESWAFSCVLGTIIKAKHNLEEVKAGRE